MRVSSRAGRRLSNRGVLSMRTLFCSVVALAILASGAFGADDAGKKKKKKKGAGLSGQILKVDAQTATITVRVALKKKQTEEKEFKVTDKTTVTEVKGEEKIALKADKVADLLKKEQFKEGASVTVETEEDGKTVKSLTFGEAKKKKKKNK
jgi:hypothetical protein